jgi:hypothetical protein
LGQCGVVGRYVVDGVGCGGGRINNYVVHNRQILAKNIAMAAKSDLSIQKNYSAQF